MRDLPAGATRKFWNWARDEDSGVRTLYLDGTIAEESWFDDDITPKAFKADLNAGEGDIVIWINSPGGDCIAASQIYAMLMDYKGKVTVKIDGIAASAASVIAMAGTEVLMAPTALMMVHNPLTIAIGDSEEMQKAISMLDEVKESIINAYEIKTGQSRAKLSHLMDAETWLNANKAIELGFADGILEDEKKRIQPDDITYAFSRRAVTNSLLNKVKPKIPKQSKGTSVDVAKATPADWLEKRLSLISH
ncbi:Clp protease ClpP [Bacillota bacterium LX-D]|nr:Clp protease ClpP [Bacillota bacterium LX-D]